MNSGRFRLGVWAVLTHLLAAGAFFTAYSAEPTPAPTKAAGMADAPKAAADSEGARLLADLVERARKEGHLNTATRTQVGPYVPKLIAAFNKRFGLNLDITMALGDQTGKMAQLITTLEAGGSPALDGYATQDTDMIELVKRGFVEYLDGWEKILPEINPKVKSGEVTLEQISPKPFAGYAFIWADSARGFLYNTNKIKANELPKTIVELADPKWKGRFVNIPYTSPWEMGYVLYYKQKGMPPEKWIEVMDGVGKNTYAVLRSGGVERLMIGEFDFMVEALSTWFELKDKAPDAPVGFQFWSDYTQVVHAEMFTPKGSRTPAASHLFNLWMTTPEAASIWMPGTYDVNMRYGSSANDEKARKLVQDAGSTVASFLDHPKGLEELDWLGSDEATEFKAEINRKIKQSR